MTAPRLYSEFADWWPLLSAPEEYAEEADVFREVLASSSDGTQRTLLELGSGGGNVASYLKHDFDVTLTDLAPGMLAVSRALNPECEHVEGDMRTLRLGRTFDVVFAHDAVTYMTTEDDLRAAFATAREHCRPGGVALFAPDGVKEIWAPATGHGGHDGAGRSMRYLDWSYDPDPADTTYETAYAYLLREDGKPPRVESDLHVLGLFPRATWLGLLTDAGFDARVVRDPKSGVPDWPERELFVGVRAPGSG